MPLSKPRAAAHLDQAKRNHGLYQQLKGSGQHVDWAVTLLFYTSLHLVESYLVETGSPFDRPRGHLERDTQIGLKLPQIYEEYSILHLRSQWARYRVDKPKPTLTELQAYEEECFDHIVDELRKLGVDLNE